MACVTPEQATMWRKTRAKGFTRFVLLDGVLFWSTSTMGSGFILFWLVGEDLGQWLHILGWARLVLLWFGAGVLFGATTWVWGEWQLHRRHL